MSFVSDRVALSRGAPTSGEESAAGTRLLDPSRFPLVSVVVPARDAESTITATIASVVGQTLSDWELIVVDDGCRDGTADRVRSFEDPRVRLVATDRLGLGAARNTGLSRAVGEFVAFLDADDLWTRDKLRSHVLALREQPDATFAYSWTRFIDADGDALFAKAPGHSQGLVFDALLQHYFLASGSNLFVRRSAALAVGGFDEELWAGQDWDFALKMARRGRLVLVPRYQVLYRIVEGAMSSDARRSAAACAAVVRRAADGQGSASGLRRALRSIWEYEMFLLLSRSPTPDFDRRARRVLVRGLREDPRWLGSSTMWSLATVSFLCAVLPRARRRPLVYGLMALFGAWQRLVHRQIRQAPNAGDGRQPRMREVPVPPAGRVGRTADTVSDT